MKKLLVCLNIICFIFLTGCSISTPIGTFSYDSNSKTETIIMTTEIDTNDMKSYVNSLLDSVVLPNGTTKEELYSFIDNSLNTLGIDLDTLNNTENTNLMNQIRTQLEENGIDTSEMTDKEVQTYIENQIKQSLEEKDINTDNLDIDITTFFK